MARYYYYFPILYKRKLRHREVSGKVVEPLSNLNSTLQREKENMGCHFCHLNRDPRDLSVTFLSMDFLLRMARC